MSALNSGRYAAAETGFRALLAAEPRHAPALHFLGFVLQTQHPLYWNNLAGVLDQMGPARRPSALTERPSDSIRTTKLHR